MVLVHGEIRRSGCPCISGQVTRFGGCPSAALASSTFAGPRSTYAAPTAMTAPVTAAIAGSSLGIVNGRIGSQAAGGVHRRALDGPPIVPQAMMYAPTASGTNGPFSVGPLARL